MAKKKPKRDEEWAEAKRRCKLSAEDVRMAKELGMSPAGLIKNIPSPSEPWKQPIKEWIQELYAKKEKKAKKKAGGGAAAKAKAKHSIFIQYRCKDGSVTVAKTASMGLLHWFGRITPHKPIENPKPFVIYVTSERMPTPYHPLFLSLVVAGLERTFGTAPEIPAHLLDAAHYEKFSDDLNFSNVDEHVKNGVPEVLEYEEVCLGVLRWLRDQGEITSLVLDEPMKPLGW